MALDFDLVSCTMVAELIACPMVFYSVVLLHIGHCLAKDPIAATQYSV